MYGMNPALMSGLDGTGRNGIGNMITVAVPILGEDVLNGLVEWTASFPPHGSRDTAACQVRDMIFEGTFALTDTDYAI
jgi:hypothetical protein